MKKTNIVLRCTDRNKACKIKTASLTPLSIDKTTSKILHSVVPGAECKEDELKENGGVGGRKMKEAEAHLGHLCYEKL